MDKATHSGSCQICGRVQKLPGNVLSKHGYTTRWGFFSGTCPGSGYRPFEVAFDRIQAAIDDVKMQIAGIESDIVTMNAAPVENVAPFHAYRSASKCSRYERSGHYESTVTLTPGTLYGDVILTHAKDDTGRKTESSLTYSLHGTIEQIVLKLRADKQRRMEGWVADRQKFVDWQEHRIATWKPGTLTAVKEAA
jgi:hypothetical protein